jgi:arginyl-tRNA--protein-N-Asp/Glu arginylyltransferase
MSEEEKICTRCKEAKPITDFSTNGKSKSGKILYRSQCKVCRCEIANRHYSNNKEYHKEKNRKNYLKNIKDKWYGNKTYYVYYLPQHHYIGMTKNLKARLSLHYNSNKIVDDFEIVGEYDTAIEAHLVETQLHYMGYEGFRY